MIKEFLIDLIYPRRCPVCDEIVPADEKYICRSCKKKIRYIEEPKCRKCGKQLSDEENIMCYDCTMKSHEYVYGFGLYDYQNMKSSIFRFKYGKRAEYAKFYAIDMYHKYDREIAQIQADAIIPVPIHKDRLRERGYNQAYELAYELSKVSGIPFCPKLIKRIKYTVPQKKLDEVGRQNNLKKAFHISTDVVKLNRVILVDDIYTTGSTIDAVAKELKQRGIGEIYYFALTIGEGL